jgi:hypothetical protein
MHPFPPSSPSPSIVDHSVQDHLCVVGLFYCVCSTLLHHANFLDDKPATLLHDADRPFFLSYIFFVFFRCSIVLLASVVYLMEDKKGTRCDQKREQPPYPQKHMLFWQEENSTSLVLCCKVNVLELLLKSTLEIRHVCSGGSWDANETCSFTIRFALLIPSVYAFFKETNFKMLKIKENIYVYMSIFYVSC